MTTILKDKLRDDTLIFEIGYGIGSELFPFHNNGYNVIGFDFNSKRIEVGNKDGLNLFKVAKYKKMKFLKKKF